MKVRKAFHFVLDFIELPDRLRVEHLTGFVRLAAHLLEAFRGGGGAPERLAGE